MSSLFPFITLKSLNNGYTYHGKVKKFLQEDYNEQLKRIDDSKINIIADYLNGVNIQNKLFDALNWSLYINPIPDLEIYLLCAREDEKNEFSVVYGRNAKNIPTDDVYAFTLMYIITLAKIGDKTINFDKQNFTKKFASIKPLLKSKYKAIIENYLNSVKLFNVPFLEKKFSKSTYFLVKNNTIFYRVFKDFIIKFNISDNIDISVTTDAIKTHGAKLVITFIGLIINALKREMVK